MSSQGSLLTIGRDDIRVGATRGQVSSAPSGVADIGWRNTATRTAALQACLGSVQVDEFFSRYWDALPLYVPASEMSAPLEALFSVNAVEELITMRDYPREWISLIRNSRHMSSKEEMDDSLNIWSGVAAGATILMNRLERTWPPIAAFTRELAQGLGARVKCNAYLTPPNSVGFTPHQDDHNVLIIQVAGRKEWTIWPSPKVPSDIQCFHATASLPEPNGAWEMRPGDVAYVPRGLIHMARSMPDQLSLHLTFAIRPLLWREVFRTLLDSALSSEDFSSSVLLHAAQGVSLLNRNASDALRDCLLNVINYDHISAYLHDQVLAMSFEPPMGVLHSVLMLPQLAIETRLRPTAGPWRMDLVAQHLLIVGRGRTISLPEGTHHGLTAALQRNEVTVAQLMPDYDDHSCLLVAEVLLSEGVVTVAPPTESYRVEESDKATPSQLSTVST